MKRSISRLLAFVMMFTMLFTSLSFAADTYTVKDGDVLWKIAQTNGTAWEKLAEINALKNPHLIFPNQELKLKAEEEVKVEPKVEVKPEPKVEEKPKAEEKKEEQKPEYKPLANPFPEALKTIQILHTNDMHGFFEEGKYTGMGAAKLKTAMELQKELNPNTLVLDAGDAMQGDNLVTLSKGAKAVEVLNALGYDAMVAGNHEFDYGLEKLMENDTALAFPMLAANVKKEDGSDLLPEYIIKEVDGVKIAIIGYATPETSFKSHPANTKGVKFERPVDTTNRLIKKLREEEKADIVIGLAHLGDEGDDPASTVGEVGGVDIIIDGHSHSTYPEGIWAKDTLIASTGEKTKNLGVVYIALDKDNKITDKKAMLITKKDTANITPNAEMTSLIESVKAGNKKIESEIVGKTDVVLLGERGDVRTGETNLGNILVESLKDIAKSDLALTNGGGIRASIDVGDITKGEVLTVLPFGNTVRVIELSGADVKAALENGLSDYPTPKGAFPHIAGMTVTFDSSKEAGSRVVSVKVGEEDLDPAKMYTLATNDFLVAGGDGYKMFKGKKVTAEFNAMDQVFIDYLAAKGTEGSEVTGRIKEVNGVEPKKGEH